MPAADPSPASFAPEVAVWADAEHAAEAARLLDLMGRSVRPIAVGGPRGGDLAGLAKPLDLDAQDDLRQMIVEWPAAFLLLAGTGEESPADLAAAIAGGTTVLALEPACTTLAGFAELDRPARIGDESAGLPGRLVHLPRFTHTPGFLAVTETHDVLGGRRSLVLTTLGGAEGGSLFMRLHDAWTTALAFCDLPETIHASDAGLEGNSLQGPRELAGRLWAHAHCPAGSSILIAAADNAPHPAHFLSVLGETGQLDVAPTGYRLTRQDGTVEDEQPITPAPPRLDQIADQWRRLIDQRTAGVVSTPADAPGTRHDQNALACTLAALLSAKTGQPESPQRVMQMSRG